MITVQPVRAVTRMAMIVVPTIIAVMYPSEFDAGTVETVTGVVGIC